MLSYKKSISPNFGILDKPVLLEEEFEDTKGVIRIRKSKDRQHNSKNKKDKQQSAKHYTKK
jgi:hypothetical protein